MNLWEAYPEVNNELKKVEDYMKKVIRSRKKVLTDISLDLIGAGGEKATPCLCNIRSKMWKI